MSALTNLEQTAERSVPNCLAIAGMGDYCGRVFLHIPPPCPVLGDGLLCNLMIRIRGHSMLLSSMQVIPRSQHEEESALLRCNIEELNKNTVRLIAEAEKLSQESKQLSERIKTFENPSTKPKWPPSTSY